MSWRCLRTGVSLNLKVGTSGQKAKGTRKRAKGKNLVGGAHPTGRGGWGAGVGLGFGPGRCGGFFRFDRSKRRGRRVVFWSAPCCWGSSHPVGGTGGCGRGT